MEEGRFELAAPEERHSSLDPVEYPVVRRQCAPGIAFEQPSGEPVEVIGRIERLGIDSQRRAHGLRPGGAVGSSKDRCLKNRNCCDCITASCVLFFVIPHGPGFVTHQGSVPQPCIMPSNAVGL